MIKTNQNKQNSKNPKSGFLGMRIHEVCIHMPQVRIRMQEACACIHTKKQNFKAQPNDNQTKPSMLLILIQLFIQTW